MVGRERRYCALAADDPWARRRSVTLEEVRERTVAIDRRTGTTTTDIDDWLAVIASGRCVGITPESTVTQYRRQGIAFRPLRDADPVPVWCTWRRQDPHPATHAAVAPASELYPGRGNRL
jgi:DNA-binding transcriptional LysR family regulator